MVGWYPGREVVEEDRAIGILDRATARLVPFVPKAIARKMSRRYIAGETLDEALNVIRTLNDLGARATLDVLGEYITNLNQAESTVREYGKAIESIKRNSLDANISVKLSSLGLLLDEEYCFQRARELAAKAKEAGNFVRIDMEDSRVTSVTLDIHRKLFEEFGNTGVALQGYLRRTQSDVQELIRLGANVRLCKGIYVEPLDIAWQDHSTINRNYTRALRRLLERGCYVGIATHDERLIWEAEAIIGELGLDKSKYEFQMLLGVRENLRDVVLKSGHHLRIYVPYGPHWYGYSTRRLRENPRMAGYALKAMFGGKS